LKRNKLILVIFLAAASIAFCFLVIKSFVFKQKMNVVFIVVDSLRADHLGCYGYGRDTTPVIDKLAREGTLFRQAFSHGGYTYLSVPTLLTSLYPEAHGVVMPSREAESAYCDLKKGVITFPEIFLKNGYMTAAFGGPNFEKMPYLKRCFQFVDIVSANDPDRSLTHDALDWLKKNRGKPFFLYLHYYDLHFPYNLGSPFLPGGKQDAKVEEFIELLNKDDIFYLPMLVMINDWFDANQQQRDVFLSYLLSRYDGEIRYVDYSIGAFLEGLKRLGLSGNTLVILTSDHGEEFYEHGNFLHTNKFYDELIHVPLILRMPNVIPGGKVIADVVRHIDIMPTVCDILGVGLKVPVEGVSLMSFVRNGNGPALELYSSVAFAADFIASRISNVLKRQEGPTALLDLGAGDEKKEGQIYNELKSKAAKENILHEKVLRTQKWKLIESYNSDGPDAELYDLESDPQESDNLAEKMPELVERLKNKMMSYEVK